MDSSFSPQMLIHLRRALASHLTTCCPPSKHDGHHPQSFVRETSPPSKESKPKMVFFPLFPQGDRWWWTFPFPKHRLPSSTRGDQHLCHLKHPQVRMSRLGIWTKNGNSKLNQNYRKLNSNESYNVWVCLTWAQFRLPLSNFRGSLNRVIPHAGKTSHVSWMADAGGLSILTWNLATINNNPFEFGCPGRRVFLRWREPIMVWMVYIWFIWLRHVKPKVSELFKPLKIRFRKGMFIFRHRINWHHIDQACGS